MSRRAECFGCGEFLKAGAACRSCKNMTTKPNSGTVSVSRKVHNLKIHQQPFEDLLSGAKTAEVRDCSDRDFQVGDKVELFLVDSSGGNATRSIVRVITHVQTGYGLPEGICVLSYAKPADQQGEENYPPCDYCGIVPDYHPWHGSGMLRGVENRHIHACHTCRGSLPAHVDQQGEPVAWQWRRKTVQEGSQWTAWTDCAKGDYEACIASPQPSVRGIIREARRLYAAQPATAKVGGEVLEKLKELVSAVRSINRSPKHEIRVIGDDKPCYAQRKEWVEWLLSICDDADEVAKLNGIET